MGLLVFTLSVFGLTFVIGQSKASYPLRTWFAGTDLGASPFGRGVVLGLIECPACLGFHLGWIAFLFRLTPPELTTWWISALFCCATSLLLVRAAGLDE